MVSVIIINDEYPDLTTQLGSEISWDKAGVYDVINTMIVGNEIAHKMKNEKDITKADIEANIYGYFGILIEELINEVIERLINVEGCSYDGEDNKIIINKTEKDKTKKLVNQIIKQEEDSTIEYIRTYEDANNLAIVPDGDYKYMIEFFSEELIDPKEDIETYGGHFSGEEYNGDYIRDCMKLINKIEQRAQEIQDKYSNLGCDVSIGDFNIGCQYGMAIYVWVPLQE
jgi:hypothetical protein